MSSNSNRFLETKDLQAKPHANSRTHWERLDALSDSEIDTSDISPMTEEDFERSEWRLPSSLKPSLRAKASLIVVEVAVDEDILVWFQSQGMDYQDKMRAALRLYAEAHQASVL